MPKLEHHPLPPIPAYLVAVSSIRNLSTRPAVVTTEPPNIENEMCRVYSTNGENRYAYRILVGKPEKKRPLGRPRRKWVDNIKLDLRDIGSSDMHWIYRDQDRD
jgi:hypothetical protein